MQTGRFQPFGWPGPNRAVRVSIRPDAYLIVPYEACGFAVTLPRVRARVPGVGLPTIGQKSPPPSTQGRFRAVEHRSGDRDRRGRRAGYRNRRLPDGPSPGEAANDGSSRPLRRRVRPRRESAWSPQGRSGAAGAVAAPAGAAPYTISAQSSGSASVRPGSQRKRSSSTRQVRACEMRTSWSCR